MRYGRWAGTSIFARVSATGVSMSSLMSSKRNGVSSRVRCALRLAPVLVVGLVMAGAPSRALAQGPAKGTEILWDRYGVPHIFAPDHASLFYAYGYAQMEAPREVLVAPPPPAR